MAASTNRKPGVAVTSGQACGNKLLPASSVAGMATRSSLLDAFAKVHQYFFPPKARYRASESERIKARKLREQYPGHKVIISDRPLPAFSKATVVFVEEHKLSSVSSVAAISDPRAKVPKVNPVFPHDFGCGCEDLLRICPSTPKKAFEVAAYLEMYHEDKCPKVCGDLTHRTKGPVACTEEAVWYLQQDHTPIGNNFSIEDFNGSPQQHAVLNRHLLDYFKGVARSRESTPYAIDNSQLYLLPQLGMEPPLPDAPVRPHGLHKCIEEFQLRRMSQWLVEGQYGLISVKSSKLHLLPKPGSIQNPIYQSKDVSRYPGSGITTSSFENHGTHFLHDVSSEVGPHELVERLVSDNPHGHLFVTGMNPIEVVDRARSFEPASHIIDYDLEGFNYVFTGSEAEAYYTPIGVTVSWLRTNSIVGSNGLVYQVVLLDYKLGHCVWHVFQADVAPQESRTFSTGSYVQVPAVLTGTWQDEWIPSKMLTAILSFAPRTPDTTFRNYAAKVSQLMTNVLPKMTAKEHWIATHLVHQLPGNQTWAWRVKQVFWKGLALASFQWQLLKSAPDIYDFVDERKRYRVLHPTPGGGWSPRCKSSWRKSAIPNCPSMLQRVSAFTSSVFTFLLPKILIGEVVSQVVLHVPFWQALKSVYCWADVNPLRVALTVAIIAVTSVLPGHVVKVFSRLSGHFWRQLWLPGWISTSIERFITEVCGGPGARVLMALPGRGWFFQAYLWSIGIKSILPGLLPGWIVPWLAMHTGLGCFLLGLWFSAIILENMLARWHVNPIKVSPVYVPRRWSYTWADALGDWFRLDFESMVYPMHLTVYHSLHEGFRHNLWRVAKLLNWIAGLLSPSTNVLREQPHFQNLPLPCAVAPRIVVTRNVDRPLPAVSVQPRIAVAPGASAVAISPEGLPYHDWLREVSTAYQADPVRYPALTPGQSCFWDCVASFGGTAHMWYSWYMAYTGEMPDYRDPVIGNVTQTDMIQFAVASQYGLNLRGLSEVVHESREGWPTLFLRLTTSPIEGSLHVELAGVIQDPEPVANLARLLKTVRGRWPEWAANFETELNNSNVDSVPRATPWLIGVANGKLMPATRNEVADAVVASYSCAPFTPANQEGYALDFLVAFDAPAPTLLDYDAAIVNQRIASSSNGSMWLRFNGVARKLRILVPTSYTHAKADLPKKIGNSGGRMTHLDGGNYTPAPARWTVLRSQLARLLSRFKGVELPKVALSEEIIEYVPDLNRAARLVSDLKAHPSVLGSRGDATILQSLDAILDLHRLSGHLPTTRIRAYLGVAGSGKTRATIAYLKTLTSAERQQVRIASHTESLRAQAKYQIDFPELRGFNFPTIPSLVTEPCVGSIVLDEAGKYYGGLLDLIILANPLLTEVVVNGDPAQAMARFPVSGTQSEYDLSPLAAIALRATKYATISHRVPRAVADVLGIHTTNSIEGHITHTLYPKLGLPVCTASPRYAGVLAGAGRRAYTYEGIQGEDFTEEVEVDATGLEGALLDRSAYVALTRSHSGVYLHMDALSPKSDSKSQPTSSDLINSIIFGMRAKNSSRADIANWLSRAAFVKHLSISMPALPWFMPVGASVPAGDYQLVAQPATTHFVADTLANEHQAVEGSCSATPPVDEFVRETHWDAKEHRELPGRGGATNQFKDVSFVNPHVHHRSDTATYFMSVDKRLSARTQVQNHKRMLACKRRDMCDEFDKLVRSTPIWSAAKHAEYVDRSVDEYAASRTQSAVLNKLRSHDPDRTGADIKITLKNQVIKKDEKRHKKEAIPGQLVHEYDIQQTLLDAPYALFLEDELVDAFPSNFVFYRRMNPQQFIDKYKLRWRVDNGVYSSDVTRWDVGCDAGMLNFDVHVMRRCGFPADYIAGFIERRLSSRSQHGPMGTMQNSGDRYTWVLNSIRRAVVTSLVNDVTTQDTVVINGDDSAIDRFALSKVFPDSPWEFKDSNSMRGEFSGFELGGPVPTYSAQGILYRTMILESRDPSAMDKWVNYLGLLAFADPNSPEAAAVARSAKVHMKPELFALYLPAPLRALFDEFSWFKS